MNDSSQITGFARIAVSGPMRRSFTYSVPENLPVLEPGQRVLVPFGRARKVGFYLGPADPLEGIKTKPIIRPVDHTTYFSRELFDLCTWIADYYFANPADCLAAALPSTLKTAAESILVWGSNTAAVPDELKARAKTGRKLSASELKSVRAGRTSVRQYINDGVLTEVWPEPDRPRSRRIVGYHAARLDDWKGAFAKAKISPRPFDGMKSRAELIELGWTAHYIGKAVRDGFLDPVYYEDTANLYDIVPPRENLETIQLTGQQQDVFDRINKIVKDPAFQVFLLHGVTGSGKTIVYCHLAREAIRRGRTVLVLTPEIALTGTTLAYFRGIFGDRVTVIHSAMTDRERMASFNGIRAGRYDVVIGPRSAVFAPVQNLGLIVVDEEHDPSYKQDDPAPRFQGRDCAIMRGQLNNVPVILGSASPSVESYARARSGKYELLELTERPAGAKLPEVRIVDMKTSRLGGDLPFLSFTLKKEVEARLKANEQVILFLNRRGYSPQLKCAGCGRVASCPNCQVKLTYHKVGRKLSCHYCGWMDRGYDICPACQSPDVMYVGAGTQRIEETIPRLFDGATAVRLDSDAASGKRRLHDILTDFAGGKSNLLLGTQMVTKGLDLPGVTLVGVLSADLMLDLPDFRASERTFAQLLQVAGRSGRAEKPGEVLIQTYYPDNDVIAHAANQNYRAFYDEEIRHREDLRYPPFSRIANFVMSGKDERQLQRETDKFRDGLDDLITRNKLSASILGPAPCPMYYLRGQFRRQMYIKTTRIQALTRALTEWEETDARFGIASAIKITVDIDPDDMM